MKPYRLMKDDDVTALVKLVSHCGIRLKDAMNLEKENFDLTQKTILFRQRGKMNDKLRKTTIRPDDIDWFRGWLQNLSHTLFPFSSRTIYFYIHKIIKSPHSLRKGLWDEMRSLDAKDNIVAVKMGHYVDVDPDEKTELFIKLQEWEEKHFGGKT